MLFDNFNYISYDEEYIIKLIYFDLLNNPIFHLIFNIQEEIDKKIIYYYNKKNHFKNQFFKIN